jgi:holo-[acyl-carrier protein] synthase
MNILGLGLEIVDQRLWSRKLKKSRENFFGRNFTLKERQYCDKKRAPLTHYSARWASKIAVIRALDLKEKQSFMKGIEVKINSHGKPSIHLDPAIASKRKDWKIHEIKISLSHSDAYSVAEVVILGKIQ